MRRQWMLRVIRKLRRSRAYLILEDLVVLLRGRILIRSLVRKIRKAFVVVERKINRIIRKMRIRGFSDGERMRFYRLVRRSLPAFSRAMSLNIAGEKL